MSGSAVPRGLGWLRPCGAALLVVAGCASAPPVKLPASSSAAPTPAESLAAPGLRPSASPTSEPTSTTYTSSLYGYTVTLPPSWVVVPASTRWDGLTDPGHEEPTVDKMSGPTGDSLVDAWAFS